MSNELIVIKDAPIGNGYTKNKISQKIKKRETSIIVVVVAIKKVEAVVMLYRK